jgi:hypothetical protein
MIASRRVASAGARWAALRLVGRRISAAIRRARSEFSGRHGLQAAWSENFFGGGESSDHGDCRSSRGRCGSVRSGSLARDANWPACRKLLCHKAFRRSAKFPRASRARTDGGIVATGARGDGRRGDDVERSRYPPFVKRSRCFSHCAVVIGVQCMSIRDCTVPKSPSLMARRAVWRRELNRRRSPRRRRLRRRRSAKPRAERSSLRRVHAIGKLPRVASHLSAGSHASMRNAAAGPADKVDDGGRRRHPGSAFMVCGLGVGSYGRLHQYVVGALGLSPGAVFMQALD